MNEKINNPQGFEIVERINAAMTGGGRYIIIQGKCKDTGDTIWVTGDDRVCAVTREDFLRGKLDYNSVLIQEFPLEEHTPENVGHWRPLIETFVELMLTCYMERDGFVRVYPWWLPKHAYAHYGQEMFDEMCKGCDHIILYASPQTMEFVPKQNYKKAASGGEQREGVNII